MPIRSSVGNSSDDVLAHAFMALLNALRNGRCEHYAREVLFLNFNFSILTYCRLYGITPHDAPLTNASRSVDDVIAAARTTNAGGVIFPNPNAPAARPCGDRAGSLTALTDARWSHGRGLCGLRCRVRHPAASPRKATCFGALAEQVAVAGTGCGWASRWVRADRSPEGGSMTASPTRWSTWQLVGMRWQRWRTVSWFDQTRAGAVDRRPSAARPGELTSTGLRGDALTWPTSLRPPARAHRGCRCCSMGLR
jgi:hypothetical protein